MRECNACHANASKGKAGLALPVYIQRLPVRQHPFFTAPHFAVSHHTLAGGMPETPVNGLIPAYGARSYFRHTFILRKAPLVLILSKHEGALRVSFTLRQAQGERHWKTFLRKSYHLQCFQL